MNTDVYSEMLSATIRTLPKRRVFGSRVRFLRGDDDRGAWLLCVATTAPDDPDRVAMGMIRYADGAWLPPAPLKTEHAAEVFAVLDDA